MFRSLVAALILVLPQGAWAEKRVALVIGNNAYAEVAPLQKAVADAEAVAGRMQAAGYEVILQTDVGRRATNLAISRFADSLSPGDTAFIFYAGHGVQIDGENYLLPTDIAAPSGVSEGFVTAESIALSSLLERVRRSGARTTVAIVDACRDNPFAAKTGRSIGGTRGLARIAAPEGTFVVFSAGAGQQALDRLSDGDENRNSVFTRALLPKLDEEGLELRDMIFDLREEVRDLARSQNHQQFPAYYDELLGDFYFRPVAARGFASESAPAPAPVGGDIRADFDLARSIGTRAAYESFVSAYEDHPDQFVVSVARDLLAALAPETAAEPDAPVVDDARGIMAATQAELNRLGCNAGGADGIAGRRTRAAFAAYLAESGSGMTAGDLGSARALTALRGEKSRICKAKVAAPAPVEAPGDGGAEVPVATMVGTWSFSAKCPLFITSTGSVTLRRTGATTFAGTMRDSLGQTGTVTGQMKGQNYSLHVTTESAAANESGTVSADGKSYRGRNSFGCSVTARRVR